MHFVVDASYMLSMGEVEFSDEERAALFDEIAENYFNQNFGSMMKSDLETMIFSAYVEHAIKNGISYDDYSLSRVLGITEGRVRSLKERKRLKYPKLERDWKEAFVDLIPKARYNSAKQLVQVSIQEVNLLKELRHYVYEHGWFDEYQLNPRLFQCQVEFFVSLCKSLEAENEIIRFDKETEKKLKALVKNDPQRTAIEKIIDGNFEVGIKELVKNGVDDVFAEVLKTIPFGGIARKAINSLVGIIIK